MENAEFRQIMKYSLRSSSLPSFVIYNVIITQTSTNTFRERKNSFNYVFV